VKLSKDVNPGNRVQVSTEEVLSNCVNLLMMSHSYVYHGLLGVNVNVPYKESN